MAENQDVVVNEVPPQEPAQPGKAKTFFIKVWKGFKEKVRKTIVGLKRRPSNIGFLVLVISTIVILCELGNLSQLGLQDEYNKEMQGMCVFALILMGILILMLYMNAFPKRSKKPKMSMYILTIVFMLALIAMDLYLYIIWGINRAADWENSWYNVTYWENIDSFYFGATSGCLVHAILVAISLVLMVLSPVIGKLLKKINTSVKLEAVEFKEAIDVEDE